MTDRLTHGNLLTHLAGLRTENDVVVATMTAGVLWPQLSQHPMDISFMAPMGAASPMGLGIALARPDLGVIVIDGDGALLMNLGTLVTIGGQRPPRLLHLVMENEGYDITGGQPLPGTGTQHVPEFARALGYQQALRSADPSDVGAAVESMHEGRGPILLAVPVTRDFDFGELADRAGSEAGLARLGRRGFSNLRSSIAARG